MPDQAERKPIRFLAVARRASPKKGAAHDRERRALVAANLVHHRLVVGFAERLAFIRLAHLARDEAGAVVLKHQIMKEALATFRRANADLRRVLNGDFNAEERRRMAQINRQRFLEALALISRAVTAWGV